MLESESKIASLISYGSVSEVLVIPTNAARCDIFQHVNLT